jgi:hypothetical protein
LIDGLETSSVSSSSIFRNYFGNYLLIYYPIECSIMSLCLGSDKILPGQETYYLAGSGYRLVLAVQISNHKLQYIAE